MINHLVHLLCEIVIVGNRLVLFLCEHISVINVLVNHLCNIVLISDGVIDVLCEVILMSNHLIHLLCEIILMTNHIVHILNNIIVMFDHLVGLIGDVILMGDRFVQSLGKILCICLEIVISLFHFSDLLFKFGSVISRTLTTTDNSCTGTTESLLNFLGDEILDECIVNDSRIKGLGWSLTTLLLITDQFILDIGNGRLKFTYNIRKMFAVFLEIGILNEFIIVVVHISVF